MSSFFRFALFQVLRMALSSKSLGDPRMYHFYMAVISLMSAIAPVWIGVKVLPDIPFDDKERARQARPMALIYGAIFVFTLITTIATNTITLRFLKKNAERNLAQLNAMTRVRAALKTVMLQFCSTSGMQVIKIYFRIHNWEDVLWCFGFRTALSKLKGLGKQRF